MRALVRCLISFGFCLACLTAAFARQPPPVPQIQYLEGHTAAVRDVACTADGKLLLSVSVDGTLCVWDRASGKSVRAIPAGDKALLTLAVTPDDLQALVGSVDGRARLLEVPRPHPLYEIAGLPVAPSALADSGDSELVVVGDGASTVRSYPSTSDGAPSAAAVSA